MISVILPTLEEIDETYTGPTDESNWVIPGKLLAGAFPGDDLRAILATGVTTFVCLQKEYDPTAPEALWRVSGLRPYSHQVEHFVQFGIEDCNVVEDAAVLDFAKGLALRLQTTDEVMYIHCWGGHGRTGTVVCLLLHLLYGLDADACLERCQILHDTRRIPIAVRSPQTQKQRDQVTRIINDLLLPRPRLAPNQVSFDENDFAKFPKIASAEPLSPLMQPSPPPVASKKTPSPRHARLSHSSTC